MALVLAIPGEPLLVGGGALALTDYARILLGVGLAGGLGVLVVSRLATWEATGPATLLVAAAGLGLALGLAGALPGLLAAGAAAAVAATVALAHPATPGRVRALTRELRGATVATTVGLVAVSLVAGGDRRAGRPAPGRRRWPRWPPGSPWDTGSGRSRCTRGSRA